MITTSALLDIYVIKNVEYNILKKIRIFQTCQFNKISMLQFEEKTCAKSYKLISQ